MIFAILMDNGFIYCACKFDLISDNQEVIGICNLLSIFGLISTCLNIFFYVYCLVTLRTLSTLYG